MRRQHLIDLGLFVITAAVFWPVVHCQFLNLDDWAYVTENARVRQGLSLANVGWAFRSMYMFNWHPLTWLSHMLDCQLFGISPVGPHLVNLLFHIANTIILCHWLRRMTGQFWPSAVVAALFALHPLHVESVAWVSERKDVLSTFFGLLSLVCYGEYGRSQKSGGSGQGGSVTDQVSSVRCRWYWWSLVFFVLGLMSKPMLVTWPCLFLLLDFWPLERISSFRMPRSTPPVPAFRGVSPGRLLLEKLPFFALSIGSSMITVVAQRHGGAVVNFSQIDLSERINNTLVSYVLYIGKLVWPHDLAAYYPYTFDRAEWQIAGSLTLLVVITLLVFQQARRRPYLIFGWLWFLGTLFPVIGLVQVGGQSMADRYLYVPSIGLFVMLVWGIKDLAEQWGVSRRWLGVLAAVGLTACAMGTSRQLRYWQNGEKLFRHAIEVTTNNAMAEFLLGDLLAKERKFDEGLQHLEVVVRINPAYTPAHVRIADLLAQRGLFQESIAHYRVVLRYRPDSPAVLNNLAWILATNPDPAIRDGAEAVQLAEHACALTRYQAATCVGTLAAAYAEAGRFNDAITTAGKAEALATAMGETELAQKNLQFLQLYRENRPYREAPQKP